MTTDPDSAYFKFADHELIGWQMSMRKNPSFFNRTSKKIQQKINSIIPEKVHVVITKAIKEITRGVIFGAGFTTFSRKEEKPIEEGEARVRERINFYSSSAAAEGAVTGFGGFLLSLADFPLWLTLKMKMLFEIASHYGHETHDYKERIYLLYIFQLTFSSQERRNEIYHLVEDWDKKKETLPPDLHGFDWRTFQLEYRDYIDIAKLLQLIPGVGAIAGAFVNHRLTNKLGKTAINAYRMRMPEFKQNKFLEL